MARANRHSFIPQPLYGVVSNGTVWKFTIFVKWMVLKVEKNYSRTIINEVEYPNRFGKLERFIDEYGKIFYKESLFDTKNNRNLAVTYEFSFDGNYATIFSFFNTFAYYLGYTGNIDDDLKTYSSFSDFEDYEIDDYLLRYRDKNNTFISISSDIEQSKLKIGMSEGAITSNMDYYDDNIVEAFASFKVHRGL